MKERGKNMQDELRKQVKLLKALQNVSYNEVSTYLEIHKNSFYNWLNGYYNLSAEKEKRLKEIIDLISE